MLSTQICPEVLDTHVSEGVRHHSAFATHSWNSTHLKSWHYSIGQRMLLSFISCQILVFSNPYICILVSRINCHFQHNAVKQSLCKASELHDCLANARQCLLILHSWKEDVPVIWPATLHWEVNIFFGLSVQKLSKLPLRPWLYFGQPVHIFTCNYPEWWKTGNKTHVLCSMSDAGR